MKPLIAVSSLLLAGCASFTTAMRGGKPAETLVGALFMLVTVSGEDLVLVQQGELPEKLKQTMPEIQKGE